MHMCNCAVQLERTSLSWHAALKAFNVCEHHASRYSGHPAWHPGQFLRMAVLLAADQNTPWPAGLGSTAFEQTAAWNSDLPRDCGLVLCSPEKLPFGAMFSGNIDVGHCALPVPIARPKRPSDPSAATSANWHITRQTPSKWWALRCGIYNARP